MAAPPPGLHFQQNLVLGQAFPKTIPAPLTDHVSPPQWEALGRDCDKIMVENGTYVLRLMKMNTAFSVVLVLVLILGVGLASSGAGSVSDDGDGDGEDGPQSTFLYGYLVLFFIGTPAFLFLLRTQKIKISDPLQALATRISGEWTGVRVEFSRYNRRRGASYSITGSASYYMLDFLVGAADAEAADATVAADAPPEDTGVTVPAASTVADSRSHAIPVGGPILGTAAVLPLYATDSHQSQLAALERRRNYISVEEYERQKAVLR
jgi:hypothetical protein